MNILLGSKCKKGELPLKETYRCQSGGHTCILSWDGSGCCSGRSKEIRMCVPCDETHEKKPLGTKYINEGSCEYETGNI